MPETNWAGNHAYGAGRIHEPTSMDELAAIVGSAHEVRALGTRHSFTDIADGAELVSTARIPGEAVIDDSLATVTVPAHWTYGAVGELLAGHGRALPNLASLPHISVAGAVATGTHGSGDALGSLATAVAGLELVTASGDTLHADRDDPRFDGMVVAMGSLGVVSRVTLRTEPFYEVRQRVYEGPTVAELARSYDAVFASGYSVSAFTRWADTVEQIWVKSRVTGDAATDAPPLGLTEVTVERHPILALPPHGCTPQRGVPGPWHERLPHFRSGFRPSAGAEIQSEYFVARHHAGEAMVALQRVGPAFHDVLMVSEVRTVAADDMWMSPHFGRDSVGFHFTWRLDPEAVRRACEVVEAALAPFDPRPHWGKAFNADGFEAGAAYDRFGDWCGLRADLDPLGVFANDWTRRVLGLS